MASLLRSLGQKASIKIHSAGGSCSSSGGWDFYQAVAAAGAVGLTTASVASASQSFSFNYNKNKNFGYDKPMNSWSSSSSPWYPTTSPSCTSMEAAANNNVNSNIKTIPSSPNLQRRMTAIGHFSLLSETLENPSINTFVLALKARTPWTTQRFADLWNKRGMPARHGRFHFTVQDAERGHFGEISSVGSDNVDVFMTETLAPVQPRAEILQRIQTAQTERWDLGEKLWQLDLIPWAKKGSLGILSSSDDENDTPLDEDNNGDDNHDAKASGDNSETGEALLLLRGHHALSDGASMAAALMDLSDEADQLRDRIQLEVEKRLGSASWPWWKRWFQKLLFVLWLVTGSWPAAWYHFQLYLSHLWIRLRHGGNPWQRLEQEASNRNDSTKPGLERSLSFATVATVDQAKWVAQTLAGRRATLNDVFCAAVSQALAKQLQWHRERLQATQTIPGNHLTPQRLAHLSRVHVAIPVHLKGGVILPGESVGNSIGAFLVALPGERPDLTPTQRLQSSHQELYRAKRRPTAFLSHYIAKLATQTLPTSWVSYMFARVNNGASCVVTNVRGPDHPIHLQGDKVEAAFGFVPLAPGIPIGVGVASFNGKIQLTLTAQPWAVPDADLFLSWVVEEYLDLVRVAAAKEASDGTITSV